MRRPDLESGRWATEFPLTGPSGEVVDLRRVFLSHGIASLPPMRIDERAWTFEITVALSVGAARTLTVRQARPGYGVITMVGDADPAAAAGAVRQVRHVLSLDLDLSPFYAVAAEDPELAWVTQGAGRMVRSPTVFEDVIKTICTTNTSWAGTTRMVNALVEHLGLRAPGAPAAGPYGRAFPTPAAMAQADEAFYKEVAGAGYRAAYLRSVATMVADGALDLEMLGRATRGEISDGEVEARLRALPGVGPYAAAHVMLMLGRYSRLILDSWTRPTYARLRGRTRPIGDRAIERRFRAYGPYAGLAFWLFLTRNWLDENPLGTT